MGTMTLANFRDELQFNLENRGDTGLTEERLDRWINQAYSHMTRPNVYKHPELMARYDYTLIFGQFEYPFTLQFVGFNPIALSDVTYYAGTTIDNNVPRHDVKPRDSHELNRQTKVSGRPAFYATDATLLRLIVLDKAPSAAEVDHILRVRFYPEVPRLVGSGQSTLLGDYWDTVLMAGSLFFARWWLGYRDHAVADGQFYQQLINEAVPDLELGAEDTDYRTEVKSEPYIPRSGGSTR